MVPRSNSSSSDGLLTGDSLVANRLLADDSGRWASVAEPDLRVDAKLEWAWMSIVRLEEFG